MGAGISAERYRRMKYNRLKTQQRKLLRRGIVTDYADLELRGPNFVVYFAGVGPASNGERAAWLVLRFNPERQPRTDMHRDGDVDYTNFHTRTIPEFDKGGFEAGVQRVLAHLGVVAV